MTAPSPSFQMTPETLATAMANRAVRERRRVVAIATGMRDAALAEGATEGAAWLDRFIADASLVGLGKTPPELVQLPAGDGRPVPEPAGPAEEDEDDGLPQIRERDDMELGRTLVQSLGRRRGHGGGEGARD